MRPVAVDGMIGEGGRRAVGVGRARRRVGHGQAVAAARAEVARGTRAGRPRRAALAQRRELPVRAVGLGARAEERVLRAVPRLGQDVAAKGGEGEVC
jgi:hypothetical protein